MPLGTMLHVTQSERCASYMVKLIILLDPVPELLVLFQPLDEIILPFLKFRRAAAGTIHIRHADGHGFTFARGHSSPKVGSMLRVIPANPHHCWTAHKVGVISISI
jgi:hypothetical protein